MRDQRHGIRYIILKMVNEEEFVICHRRGHSAVGEVGTWTNCTFCGFWIREVAKPEERSDKPPDEEINREAVTRMAHSSANAWAAVSVEEYANCKRRGHETEAGSLRTGWNQCKFCGTWLREVKTRERRTDAPPEQEMSVGEQLLRMANKTLFKKD